MIISITLAIVSVVSQVRLELRRKNHQQDSSISPQHLRVLGFFIIYNYMEFMKIFFAVASFMNSDRSGHKLTTIEVLLDFMPPPLR
jgi:hypothetical protein